MEELLAIPGLTRAGDGDEDNSAKRKAEEESSSDEGEEEEEEEGGEGGGEEAPRKRAKADDWRQAAADALAAAGPVDPGNLVLHTLADGAVMGVVKIPSRLVGSVIGKGGWGIKIIEGQTGAKMNFEEDSSWNLAGLLRIATRTDDERARTTHLQGGC